MIVFLVLVHVSVLVLVYDSVFGVSVLVFWVLVYESDFLY
jgi:hypothetical protein